MNRAESIAHQARAAMPNPQTILQNLERLMFIRNNKWALLDQNNRGYIEYPEYRDYLWSCLLAYAEDGSDIVTLEDYLQAHFGPRHILENIRLLDPPRFSEREESFRSLDKGQKGYLIPSDLDPMWTYYFKMHDKDQDGRLNHQEFP
jgi:hypothetical protein